MLHTYRVEIVYEGVFFDYIEYLTHRAESWKHAWETAKALADHGINGFKTHLLNVRRIY